MTITVWGAATGRTIRVHWALHELGLEYEPKLIGSRTGETQEATFQSLNSKEKIPVLVDDDFVLTESAAIVTYLGDKHGMLTPEPGSRERARYDEWTSYILMELDAHTLYIIRRHGDLAKLYGEAPEALRAARDGFTKQITWAEKRLEHKEYAVGESFSGVDILLTSCLDWAYAYEFELADNLNEYRAKLHERPAYKTAAALNFSVSAGA